MLSNHKPNIERIRLDFWRSLFFLNGYREACNWRLPDRVQRNGGREMMIGAGRMTATARADTGASEARRKAWVRGLRTDV